MSSMSDIPSASDVQAVEVEVEAVAGVEEVLAALKGLEAPELFKVMKQALAEAEKRSKSSASPKKAPAKKAGSMPKGVVPPQLRKPRAWVDFTLKHALEHGWEAFTVYQTKKDKTTGEKVEEEIEMPASELLNGAHIYKDSVDEKHPHGKQLIHKDAMSLSKQRWAPKEKMGTHHALYLEFETSYVVEADADSDSAAEPSAVSKTVVVRKTAAEKAAEAEAKKAAKEAEKAAKKAEKDAEKEAKKAEKEAEKEAKKAAAAAEKEAKKTAKAVPAAAVKKAVVVSLPVRVGKAAIATAIAAAVPKAAVPKAAAAAKPAAAKPAVKPAAWSCPADGMVHPWPYKGKQYLRNSDNEVWLKGEDGGCGEWQGMYRAEGDLIDDSVPEPVFDDEE
jgi:vacuolar-type H+-ATPase subunit H